MSVKQWGHRAACLVLLLWVGGCGIGFDVPSKPVAPIKPSGPTPTPIVTPVESFDAEAFSRALAEVAEVANSLTSERGSEVVAGTLRTYERTWPSVAFDGYQERLCEAVPAIELSGGKARDLTAAEIELIRGVR